jgi:hypothetical protein
MWVLCVHKSVETFDAGCSSPGKSSGLSNLLDAQYSKLDAHLEATSQGIHAGHDLLVYRPLPVHRRW